MVLVLVFSETHVLIGFGLCTPKKDSDSEEENPPIELDSEDEVELEYMESVFEIELLRVLLSNSVNEFLPIKTFSLVLFSIQFSTFLALREFTFSTSGLLCFCFLMVSL